jgi:hypothetical protein
MLHWARSTVGEGARWRCAAGAGDAVRGEEEEVVDPGRPWWRTEAPGRGYGGSAAPSGEIHGGGRGAGAGGAVRGRGRTRGR